jgi:predicted nucleic acid-binding protein
MKLIDTSAWIHALRPDGNRQISDRVRALLESGEAAWCPMVRLELWNGARGEQEKRVLRDLERHLPDLEATSSVWNLAVALAQRARTQGQTAPATDLLICACAQHHGVEIEHDDEHFTIIAALA